MSKKVTDLLPTSFGWYAAAAAALGLTAADGANAQIVYTDLDPDEVVMDTDLDGYLLDFDDDADPEILFREQTGQSYSLTNTETAIGTDNITGCVCNTSGGYTYFLPLSASAPISSGVAMALTRIFQSFTFNTADPNGWLGTDAFIGLQFVLDDGTHYGWVRIEMDPAGGSYTIKEYAYESAVDTPINAGVIPVELVSFDAHTNGSDVVLAWETASETNNAGFEVQLKNGDDWSVLGFVEGQGTTTEAQTYTFTAAGIDVGTHTFRLKQIDFDGAFEYSDEVEATIEVIGTHQLSNAYPNPFNPTSQFTLAVARDQRVTAELYNVLGQRVATLFNGTIEANSTRIVQIDGSALASGAYIVRVTGETFADALRVTLTK